MRRYWYFSVISTFILFSISNSYADDVYVSCFGLGTVVKIGPSGNKSNYAWGFSSEPAGVTFDNSGNLYVTDYLNGTIKKFSSSGTGTLFASGLDHPAGIAFDSKGYLYVANYYSHTIDKISPGGTRTNFLTNADAWALAFDRNDNLYAGELTQIEKITPSGTRTTFVSESALFNASGLAFDSSNYLYETNQNGTIAKIAPNGTWTTFASSSTRCGGLAFDSSGNLYCTNFITYGTVYKFDPSGNMSLFASGLTDPIFIATKVPEPTTILLLGLGAIIIRKCKV